MKTKNLILTLVVALFTTVAFAQMAGTAHDFSNETWTGGDGAGNEGRMCIVCHIAHNTTATAGAPLWNRGTVGLDGSVVYKPYSSNTFNADDAASGAAGTAGATDSDPWVASTDYVSEAYADYLNETEGLWTPNGTSVLCLTCHDGVGNLDAFGGTNGSIYAVAAGSDANEVGALATRNDGANEHPYSFTYSSALVTKDGGLNDPTSSTVLALLDGGSEGKVQCTSCHDVHNGAGVEGLLVMSNAQSALCTTCHAK